MKIEILEFEASGQLCGVPVTCVSEVVRAASLTPLPNAPTSVAGILNLRGQLVVVLRTSQSLGFGNGTIDCHHHFIVLCVNERLIGLHVDHAIGMRIIEVEDDSSATYEHTSEQLVQFAAKTKRGLVQVLDTRQLLARDSIGDIIDQLTRANASEVVT